MIVFARPVLHKTCLNCPTPFETKNPAAKYCDVCRPLMKLEMSRIAGAKKRARREHDRAEYRTYTPPPAQRRVPTLRARTLAETPDVPAEAAARGDMLTGAAPAMNHGASMGMISVAV